MKILKPGESATIRFVFDPYKKKEDYDLVIEFEIPSATEGVEPPKAYTILLDFDDGGE